MSLGVAIGLGFSLYLLISVPRKKYEKKIQEANRQLNGVINRLDYYENQDLIDEKIALEIKKIAKSNLGIGEFAERKINILMSRFM